MSLVVHHSQSWWFVNEWPLQYLHKFRTGLFGSFTKRNSKNRQNRHLVTMDTGMLRSVRHVRLTVRKQSRFGGKSIAANGFPLWIVHVFWYQGCRIPCSGDLRWHSYFCHEIIVIFSWFEWWSSGGRTFEHIQGLNSSCYKKKFSHRV